MPQPHELSAVQLVAHCCSLFSDVPQPQAAMDRSNTLHNIACLGCGCVCDDVTITTQNGDLAAFHPHCQLGENWFRANLKEATHNAEINGRPADVAAAVAHAAKIFQQADYPLIYGLSRSATPGQRAAIALAERLGGAIDTTASLCHGPSIMALQEVGEVACTLGEIRNRADLVIFWGCNPAVSHPRHAERYSVFPKGKYVPAGRSDRTVVMVGESDRVDQWRLNLDGAKPDFVVPMQRKGDFEAIASLRMMLRGVEVPNASPELRRLFNCMRESQYGVVFFGLGITETSMWDGAEHEPIGHINVAALLKLVAELNDVTRFTARRMRLQGDVSGADNVMCWHTGYPFGVDMSRGFPRYNPGEYTANELLSQRNTDACLFVGAETVRFFSESARQHLESIPTIVLDYPGAELAFTPTVRFTTGVYGVHEQGVSYRMDNVPVALGEHFHHDAPSDEFVLSEILKQCPLVNPDDQ